jgi:hypothetical protein
MLNFNNNNNNNNNYREEFLQKRLLYLIQSLLVKTVSCNKPVEYYNDMEYILLIINKATRYNKIHDIKRANDLYLMAMYTLMNTVKKYTIRDTDNVDKDIPPMYLLSSSKFIAKGTDNTFINYNTLPEPLKFEDKYISNMTDLNAEFERRIIDWCKEINKKGGGFKKKFYDNHINNHTFVYDIKDYIDLNLCQKKKDLESKKKLDIQKTFEFTDISGFYIYEKGKNNKDKDTKNIVNYLPQYMFPNLNDLIDAIPP